MSNLSSALEKKLGEVNQSVASRKKKSTVKRVDTEESISEMSTTISIISIYWVSDAEKHHQINKWGHMVLFFLKD